MRAHFVVDIDPSDVARLRQVRNRSTFAVELVAEKVGTRQQ
ncbi:MAG: hypothetical protein ABSE77_11850 [Acidimicrobiales bacterium]|jgi:hypothetical protein